MADTKISALSAAATLDGTEPMPVVQSAATVKATGAQFRTYMGGTFVTGPASAVDNAPVRFDSTTGKLVQASPNIVISDVGDITIAHPTSGTGTVGWAASAEFTIETSGKSMKIRGGAGQIFYIGSNGGTAYQFDTGGVFGPAANLGGSLGKTTARFGAAWIGGLSPNILATKTAAYTTLSTDHTVPCDATSASFVVTLVAATTAPGLIQVIKKIDASVNTVTLDPAGSETIDGASTRVLTTQWESVTIQSNGTNWYVI